MLPEVRALIDLYNLEPLPVEMTLFHQTWKSHDAFRDGEPHGTAIVGLYADEPYSVSLFHKLTVDEVWHFYAGDPLRLVLLYPDGTSRDVVMGGDPLAEIGWNLWRGEGVEAAQAALDEMLAGHAKTPGDP